MFTILIFFVMLLVLILSHEFGHFVFAKMRGIRVDEFGFGFPPRLVGKQYGETLYSLNALPFGGFVRIWGEDETGEAASDPRNFSSRSVGQRFWIIAAGVLMNVWLAYLLFVFGHIIGLPTVVTEDTRGAVRDIKVAIVEIAPGSPAASVGLQVGDTIESFAETDGTGVQTPRAVAGVQTFIRAHQGRPLVLGIRRGDQILSLRVTPRTSAPEGQGLLGIAMFETGTVSVPWYMAPWEAAKTTYYVTRDTVSGLAYFFGNLFHGTVVGDVAGPVGIARYAGEAGRMGFVYVLRLMALLSINLAVLNVLPVPALDGGRILFLLIEKIKGSPVPARVSYLVHAAGFVVLILLMVFITYRDIVKLL